MDTIKPSSIPPTQPAPQTPPAPQPAANLSTPELPHGPEKLLEPPHKNSSWGAVIGIVIILLVLIVGALYFWGAKLAEEEGGFIPEEEAATQN